MNSTEGRFGKVVGMVTGLDGSQPAMALTPLGITQITLRTQLSRVAA